MEVDPNAQLGLRIDRGKIELTAVIGCGSFSYVYRGVHVDDAGQVFAVKCLWKRGLTMEQLRYQRLEADFLATLNEGDGHPNVLRLYKIVETPHHLYLITELCEIDLFDYILLRQQDMGKQPGRTQWHPSPSEAASLMLEGGSPAVVNERRAAAGGKTVWTRKRSMTQINSSGLSEYEVRSFLGQILSALEFCHERGIYHRDIKPENILLVKNAAYDRRIHGGSAPDAFQPEFFVKLADFGLATTDHVSSDFRCGSTRYLSPEALGYGASGGYSVPMGDVWSAAVLLINMCYGKNPWTEASLDDPTFNAFVMEDADLLRREFGMPKALADALHRVFLFTEDERCSLGEFKRLLSQCPSFVSDFGPLTAPASTPVNGLTVALDQLDVSTGGSAQRSMLSMALSAERTSSGSSSPIPAAPATLPVAAKTPTNTSLTWYRQLLSQRPDGSPVVSSHRSWASMSSGNSASSLPPLPPPPAALEVPIENNGSDAQVCNAHARATPVGVALDRVSGESSVPPIPLAGMSRPSSYGADGDSETLFEWEDELGMTPLRAPRLPGPASPSRQSRGAAQTELRYYCASGSRLIPGVSSLQQRAMSVSQSPRLNCGLADLIAAATAHGNNMSVGSWASGRHMRSLSDGGNSGRRAPAPVPVPSPKKPFSVGSVAPRATHVGFAPSASVGSFQSSSAATLSPSNSLALSNGPSPNVSAAGGDLLKKGAVSVKAAARAVPPPPKIVTSAAAADQSPTSAILGRLHQVQQPTGGAGRRQGRVGARQRAQNMFVGTSLAMAAAAIDGGAAAKRIAARDHCFSPSAASPLRQTLWRATSPFGGSSEAEDASGPAAVLS